MAAERWRALKKLADFLVFLCAFGAVAGIMTPVFRVIYLQAYITPELFLPCLSVLLLVFIKPLTALARKCIENGEYDENGLAVKSNSYLKLSRKEREALDKQKLADMERILSSSAINRMTKKGSVDPEKDMKKLIGLKTVKDSMEEMAARMEFDRKNRKNLINQAHHAVFLGNPGTGKTTVARIYAGFLYKYGYIKKNQCIEVDGNFLRSSNPGDTSLKTSMLINKAIGGVLFIDEAYAMNDGGQEAVATLIKAMEDKRGQLVIVLAGYRDEMKALLEANPGFKSRIRTYLDFPDYTDQEAWEIFESMAHDMGFCVDASAMDHFNTRMRNERATKYFGNARTVRNILDDAVNLHSLNLKRRKLKAFKQYYITGMDIRTRAEDAI